MSVLSTFRKYFGFQETDDTFVLSAPLTLEEKLGEAAAERGYAFDLLESVEEALADAAELEAEVAVESRRRAELAVLRATEDAQRILENGRRSAAEHYEREARATSNAADDVTALDAIRKLTTEDSHDVGPKTQEGWDA